MGRLKNIKERLDKLNGLFNSFEEISHNYSTVLPEEMTVIDVDTGTTIEGHPDACDFLTRANTDMLWLIECLEKEKALNRRLMRLLQHHGRNV